MARNTDKRIKRTLLLFFVAISVALIIGIYATDLAGDNDPAPAFYRGAPTMDPSIELTITVPAREHRSPSEATPTVPGDEFDPGDSLYDDF